MHAFWLVLTYDLLEDRCIDDIIITTFFNSLLYTTNRFQVAVRLFSNRSQRKSKCGKNISDTLGCASCTTFLFLPHFDVISDLLLNRRTATWNLFVKYKPMKYLIILLHPKACFLYITTAGKYNMSSSHVKTSCFCLNSHSVSHWCLYSKSNLTGHSQCRVALRHQGKPVIVQSL